MSECVAGWLKDVGSAPPPWNEWLESVGRYVRTVFDRTGAYPKRTALANGNWLVVFEDPGDAFGTSGERKPELVHVFANADQVDERYEQVYKLLAQPRVAQGATEIEPGDLPGSVPTGKVQSLTHGLRLYYAQTKNGAAGRTGDFSNSSHPHQISR